MERSASVIRVVTFLVCFAMSASVLATPPPHAPAHGWRAKNRYVYYPQSQVYFSPDRRLYFWMEGHDWRVGVQLPPRIVIDSQRSISLELEATRPYLEHPDTLRRHPPHR
ncbi:MAG: hypothetical protein HY696_00515 [Deltaproteobacteria bacterium]|nr:hypothetical protein [Deltaproteobacteria bacterium]